MKVYQKYQNLPKPVKASLWFTACFVIQRGLQFIGMPIFTRLMSQEDYGTYSVFLSWFNLICVFSTLNIYSGVVNKALVKYEEDRDRFLSSVQFLTLLIGLGISGLILLFRVQIGEWTGFSSYILLLMCVHILTFPSFQYWAQKQRFDFEYKGLVFATLLVSVLNLILGVVFVMVSDNKSEALIELTVAVQLIINGFIFFKLLKDGRYCLVDINYWKWSVLLAIPLVPHYLSEILLGHADRIMINSMCGPAKAGIYNIVYQISMVMTIIRTGINGSYTPWLYQTMKNGNYSAIRSTTNFLVVMMAGMTFFLMLIGPELLRLAAPPSYYEAVIAIPAIMLGCYFIFIYVLFLNIEIYFEKGHYVAIASCVASAISIGSNFYCIPHWGYLSAGYTTMLSYMLMAIMHYIFFKTIVGSDVCVKHIFDVKFIFCSIVMLLLMGGCSLVIYKFFILRWCIITILIILVLVKRKEIINIIKSLKNK